MEVFLDRGNPVHWLAAAVLLASGAACGWIGVRDGLVRRSMRTNAGLVTGRRAVAAGAAYVATAVLGIAGAIAFLVRGR